MSIGRYEAGDTIQFTWVDSSISAIDGSSMSIIDGSEAVLVESTLTSSGNGHYYYDFTIPNSFAGASYVMKSCVTIGGKPYVRSEKFKVISVEVD